MKTKIYYILALVVGCFSCIDEKVAVPTPVFPTEEGEKALTIEIQLPAATQAVPTYGVNESVETHIDNIGILAFEVDETDPDSPVERFIYYTEAKNIQDNGSPSKKTFEALVYKKDKKQRFVLIANAPDEIESLGTVAVGTLKDNLLASMVCHNSDGWDTRSSSAFTCFPFWGESEAVRIGESTPVIETIPMLRMLARVDVVVTDEEVQKKFELTSVHLYNRKSCGRVVPHKDNLVQGKAVNVSLPSANVNTIKGPHSFTVPTEEKHSFIRSVYTFESPVPTKAEEATCVVIGGVYEGDTQPTYYRVDFVDTDDNGKVTGYKHILRNHLYRMNIADVKGSGHGGPDEAFDGKGENMTVEVVEWDEGGMSDVVFDGQYLLSVSPGEMTLSKEQQDRIGVKVFTDYPSGWTATIDNALYPWITLVPGSTTGAADVISYLYFNIAENDPANGERTAIIKVTAGRLTYNVKVIQTIGNLLSLTLLDGEYKEVDQLIFESAVGKISAEAQDLIVRWSPLTVVCNVNRENLTTPNFPWGDGDNPVAASPLAGGERKFSIAPSGMTAAEVSVENGNPFLEKRKKVTFTVEEAGETVTRDVELIQINYALIAYPASPYNLDGGTYSFKVRSNARWEAVLKSGNMVSTVITSDGAANIEQGVDFYFKTVNSSTVLNPTATFTFSSPEGKFADVDVIITGKSVIIDDATEEANCYMLKPSGNGISIPVKHANSGETTQIASGQQMRAELLWTDVKAGLAPTGAVASAYVEGSGPSAELVVIPGSSEGNAVIALRDQTSGTILWSWHIWVVDYDPANGGKTYSYGGLTFMDRNLGATSSDRGSNKAIGLTYQWGRKDPYPGISSALQTAVVPIYNAAGSDMNVTFTPVSVANNLVNSIQKPMTYYTGGSGTYHDWYTNANNGKNDNLWGVNNGTDLGKTAYDPCPAGWRVMNLTYNVNPWWNNPGWVYNSSYVGAYADAVGYWPIAGMRSSDTGNFTNITSSSQSTVYWYGLSNGNSGQGLGLTRGTSINQNNASNHERANGGYIRCVKR